MGFYTEIHVYSLGTEYLQIVIYNIQYIKNFST